MANDPLEVADTSGLTDADWAEINKLKAAYKSGGKRALSKGLKELAIDPVRMIRVIGALFPREVSEGIRDRLAAEGITRDDLLEMIRKAESPAKKEH